MKFLTLKWLGAMMSACLFSATALAMEIPEIPKVPAFLPTLDQVPALQPMPLDGTWLVTAIGKKIRIDSGRAYAVDGWTHLFVLDIQPGMVVLKDLVPTGPGQYSGEDLPLMGKLTARVMADKSISVSVAGVLGQANYKLVPVQINNQGWFQQEMQAAGFGGNNSYQNQQYQYQNQNQQYQNQQYQNQQYQNQNQNQQYQNSQYQNPQYQNQQYPPQQYQQQQPPQQFQPPPQSQQPYQANNPGSQPNQYQPVQKTQPNQQQGLDAAKSAESDMDCQEKVYDPETDTTRCYQEGDDQ